MFLEIKIINALIVICLLAFITYCIVNVIIYCVKSKKNKIIPEEPINDPPPDGVHK